MYDDVVVCSLNHDESDESRTFVLLVVNSTAGGWGVGAMNDSMLRIEQSQRVQQVVPTTTTAAGVFDGWI